MSDYFATLPSVSRDVVIAMNTMCFYSKACNFQFGDKDFSIKCKYNEILSGKNFIRANFTVNGLPCNILVPESNFYKIISVANSDLDAKVLPRDLLFQLGECLVDLMISELLGNTDLDINFLSFEDVKISNPGIFPISMVLCCKDLYSVNMIIDAGSDVLDILGRSMERFLGNDKHKPKELPDIPIVAKLVLGATTLRAENLMSGSSEVLKKGDVLVMSVNSGMNNLFVSIFDCFFYPAYLTDESIVTTEKLVDSSDIDKSLSVDDSDDVELFREDDILEDNIEE